MTVKTFSTAVPALLVVALLCFVPTAAGGGGLTSIVGTDQWPTDGVLALGDFTCAGGELQWWTPPGSPMPIPSCNAGEGPLRWRDGAGWSCFDSASIFGAPEPDFTGLAYMTFNANFNPTDPANPAYIGRVWGDWMLIPHPDCASLSLADAVALLDSPTELWQGRWRGWRSLVCNSGSCSWIGAITLTGRGHGGSINRDRFVGQESVETFSPLPFPYEMLGICGPNGCAAEGLLTGIVRKR